MHLRRSLAGVALLGALAAMAFAGAATGAPVQPQLSQAEDIGVPAGVKLPMNKLGKLTSMAGSAKPVEKNAYKALKQASAKQALLASSANRDITKPAKTGALSYKAPRTASAAAVVAADQPIADKHPNVLSSTGVNAYQQALFGGYNLEPPDPSVCAGGGNAGSFVIQVVNNQIQISDGNLNKLTAPISSESFFGDFINIQFDPLCSYNHSTGKWYLTYAVSDFATFSGVYVAVSTSSDPRSPWNIYFLDLGQFGGEGECFEGGIGLCLADQPNLGSDQYTLAISTNQYDLNGAPDCAFDFCGAIYILIDKVALALGNPSPNVVAYDLAATALPLPDGNFGNCTLPSLGPCWYSVQPADSGNGRYDTRSGGTQWAMSALDFFGIGDNRVAIWRFANTNTIGAFIPAISASVAVRETGHEVYSNPPLADQPQGVVGPLQGGGNPLGDFLVLAGLCSPGTPPDGCSNPGPIQTNDDRMRDTVVTRQDNGAFIMWGGLNTDAGGRAGIMLFGINLASSLTNTNVARVWGIHNPSADVYFPAVASFNNGTALAAYTVSGGGLFPDGAPAYPSAAYSVFSTSLAPANIHVANRGRGVQDGFTQYNCVDAVNFGGCGPWRPRWGDYSGAAVNLNQLYFSSEFIPNPNCSLFTFKDVDSTCGGTRTFYANWGTSLDRATLP